MCIIDSPFLHNLYILGRVHMDSTGLNGVHMDSEWDFNDMGIFRSENPGVVMNADEKHWASNC